MSLEHLGIAALVLAAYQLYVSLRVLFAIQYTKMQRLGQLALIWLIPLFGAIVCHVFLVTDAKRPRPETRRLLRHRRILLAQARRVAEDACLALGRQRRAERRLVAAALGGLGRLGGRQRLAFGGHAGAGFRDLRFALLGDLRRQAAPGR